MCPNRTADAPKLSNMQGNIFITEALATVTVLEYYNTIVHTIVLKSVEVILEPLAGKRSVEAPAIHGEEAVKVP